VFRVGVGKAGREAEKYDRQEAKEAFHGQGSEGM
jgi:hypothetical protein